MTPEELVGRTLAIVFAMDEGELEWEIIRGIVRQSGDGLFLERAGKNPFALRAAWLERIKRVEEDDILAIVQSELWLILTIGSLPQK